jgi:hypothetical protein
MKTQSYHHCYHSRHHKAKALINSGCEGSCIDVKLVDKYGLNSTKLSGDNPLTHNSYVHKHNGRVICLLHCDAYQVLRVCATSSVRGRLLDVRFISAQTQQLHDMLFAFVMHIKS